MSKILLESPNNGRRFWLFKTEPDCFGIEHLKALPKETGSWDGVRNYQSRNFLRDEIKKGDGLFFYHSSCPETGIAGICEVTKSGYPDHTGWDSTSEHFDPKASPANPIWYMVDVTLRLKFKSILTLTALKKNPQLAQMMVVQQGSRLSIQPVRSDEWREVLLMANVADPFAKV